MRCFQCIIHEQKCRRDVPQILGLWIERRIGQDFLFHLLFINTDPSQPHTLSPALLQCLSVTLEELCGAGSTWWLVLIASVMSLLQSNYCLAGVPVFFSLVFFFFSFSWGGGGGGEGVIHAVLKVVVSFLCVFFFSFFL